MAAAQCGALLEAAKNANKNSYLKWLSDNCPQISEDTAERWRKLANSAHVRNLEQFTGLKSAYIACGIMPDPKDRLKKTKALGTADVDIFDSFVSQIVKECDRIFEIADGVDVKDMPDGRKEEVRSAIAKVKEVEGRL